MVKHFKFHTKNGGRFPQIEVNTKLVLVLASTHGNGRQPKRAKIVKGIQISQYVVVAWQVDLQLPMYSVHITTKDKTKTKGLAPSDTQTGQSQIRFQILLSIWNFRHNNRLQFQTSCFAGSICGGSNAKGEIEVKLANVRSCR